MKKKTIVSLTLILFTGILVFQSCKKDKEDSATSTSASDEFIADSSSFVSFMNWSLDKSYNGPDPLLGAMAHANNDSTVIRDVYFKDGQNSVNGKYPVGTLVVKYSHNPDSTVNEYTAMAKRGNNFNPNYGDWEFFMLTSSGSIATDSTGTAMRGADLMGGMCGSCHNSASSKDLIFSK